jgi:GNAT superfamily N-acetyltransferase/DNA-binding ferritin-like protein (Dps family)
LKSSEYRARQKKTLCKSCTSSKTAKLLWKKDDYCATISHNSKNPSNHTIKILSESTKKQWLVPETKEKISNASKKRWNNTEYRNKMLSLYATKEYKEKASEITKKLWNNQDYRDKVITTLKSKVTDEFREHMRSISKALWRNPLFRHKMQIVLANMPKVSSAQTTLYSILDDLGVKYYREYNDGSDDTQCVIGPYHVDCLVPRDNKPDLIIEMQGTYWHSIPRNAARDKAKLTYLTKAGYEVKWVWEHELHEHHKVYDNIKFWLGCEVDIIQYDFSDVQIRRAPASEYRELLLKYHYLSSAGRGGQAWGAYIGLNLIAVVVLSPPLRQNMSFDLELSRMCIHPKYRKKNLGSWMLSRIIKNYRNKTIVAYSDSTYNHTGAIYKASGFLFDGEVKPDYWYISKDGWLMHKKTLYNRAVNSKLTEREFAEYYGYIKIYGQAKLRFKALAKSEL